MASRVQQSCSRDPKTPDDSSQPWTLGGSREHKRVGWRWRKAAARMAMLGGGLAGGQSTGLRSTQYTPPAWMRLVRGMRGAVLVDADGELLMDGDMSDSLKPVRDSQDDI
ncbi:hypothetical protein JX265_013121 [Neoarthrinium moseri]|uniref:Uncharacterized protein n=1 Tax=Neoarthrinium moseri TaxID=1658444 RepID=A0A9P9W9A4_9PEZI|nr:uncharacterized protein JN550_006402 [Neoarthrinium moseri]KAI1849106.1 hypothetical protein JX266_005067 [Neoarthrinium moseri]KAI1852150.1 hypothetical protein JX265_013121 [Neoarthrinium moseri]KAI1868486.1 hypothetical protein JN550_006402 [Neoarthrinium moseri]